MMTEVQRRRLPVQVYLRKIRIPAGMTDPAEIIMTGREETVEDPESPVHPVRGKNLLREPSDISLLIKRKDKLDFYGRAL